MRGGEVSMVSAAILLITFLAAWAGTALLRAYALRRQIIDVPNARSSHTIPTPRGGGVAIVLAFLGALTVWHCLVKSGQDALFYALLPGGLGIAAVGFWDDHCALPARVRFAVHLLCAAWAVYWLDGWPLLDLGFAVWGWGWLGAGVAVLTIVWAINLYNFMDGIDGLAGAEALVAGGAGGFILWYGGADGMPLWLLAAAAAGFLMLNWPPARIFMGDAGSGFLGYALAVLALHASVRGATSIWPWLILLAVFVVDATLTLVRRAVQGIRVTDAHRTHAYQWASRRVGGHRPVTLGVLAINLGLLFPAAMLVIIQPFWALPTALTCLALLAVLAWRFDAGVPEPRQSAVAAQSKGGER